MYFMYYLIYKVNVLNYDSIYYLSSHLYYLRELTVLHASCIINNLIVNAIDIEGIKILSENFKNISNLLELNLRNNELCKNGVEYLSDNLKYISKLTYINLYGIIIKL